MKSCRQKNGFSLVEVVIITGIISLAFMGILGLVRRSITLSYSNQNYLSAAMMAQDGLELARYIRDQNWLSGQPSFATDLSQDVTGLIDNSTTTLALDYQGIDDNPATPELLDGRIKIKRLQPADCGLSDSGKLTEYVKNNCANIYLDNNGAYSIQTGPGYTKTLFNRLLETTYHNNNTPGNLEDDYIYVSSMIYWKDRGSEKYLTLSTSLYNYSWKY